jgi:hypothetical protein
MGGFFRIIGMLIGFLLNVFLGLALVAGLTAGWGIGIEPGRVRVSEPVMALAGIPSSWPTLKIAVLSDLHIGAPHIDIAKLEQIVATVNSRKPDIVLLLGDFMPGVYFSTEIPPEDFAPVLGKLDPKYGIAAILGEHDMRGDTRALLAALKKAGIPVLVNKSIRIELAKKRKIWIAGLASTGPDYAKAVAKVPKKAPVLALVHNPAAFSAIPLNVTGVFAGHTHGGQIDIPEYGPVLVPGDTPRRYARGIIKEDAKVMFVTSGIGTGAYPIRVNMPPEIAMVTIGAPK